MNDPSVAIIGGGIAGIQAALDLAEHGYKVHIIEQFPSIGGKMALLDKTFPTMDCAVCILAPKMIEVSRHPNINILTYSQVQEISGKAGNFIVRILRNARYVDEEKCTGCDDCTEVCTVTLPIEYEMGIGMRKAIYRPFPQAVPNIFTIDKRGVPPCRVTCPAGMNVQGYIALIRERKFKEAIELMRMDIPFPSVCGRTCYHPCESECERKNLDDPIAIKSLKRFAADYEVAKGIESVEPIQLIHEEKVAIIGSGPAGLTAAYELIKKGYPVTVFESMPKLGGMLRYGIPSYRLPKDVLDLEIKRITDLGVEIQTNTIIGTNITVDELIQDGYETILLAIGAQKSRVLHIEGENLEGVTQALDLLKKVNSNDQARLSGKIVVIGGGNVAIDAARCAKRIGADEVHILYRRSRSEMPAYLADIERAEIEGIQLHFLVTPLRFIEEKGKAKAVECIKMQLGDLDESGRRRPFPIDGSEFIMEIDSAILAIGQTVDNDSVPKNIEVTKSGTIIVDKITKQTNYKNIFSCGDIVQGPATVIEAIAEGKEAAESIHRYLRGENLRKGRNEPIRKSKDVSIDGFDIQLRQKTPEIELDNILNNFDETELCFSEEIAIKEAERCLSCGGCSECLECEKVCDPGAINHNLTEEHVVINVESIIIATGLDPVVPSEITEFGYGRFKIVITALEFERMITVTGPTSGKLVRPSDLKHPHDVTFIQCVGSRSLTDGYPYCSAVCCMHATKEGILVKEHEPNSDVSIFFTDIRAFGKQFREFINRAKTEYGIKFIRAKPGEIREDPDTKNLEFWYENTLTGEVTKKDTDLLVLCTALTPSKENTKLAKILGVDVDDYGFFVQHDPIIAPMSTSCDGIYVCGFSQGPKDIPDSIGEASGIATMVSLNKNVKTMGRVQ